MCACEFIGKALISCTDNLQIIENNTDTKFIVHPQRILIQIELKIYIPYINLINTKKF